MKLIYVASPYAGDIKRNTEFAKEACRHVMNEGHKVRVTSAEVTGQTSSAAHLTGGTMFPRVPPPAYGVVGCGNTLIVKIPLGEQEGHAGRTESSPARRTVSAANLQLSQKLCAPKGMC